MNKSHDPAAEVQEDPADGTQPETSPAGEPSLADEPHTRFDALTDGMFTALQEHPEAREGDKAFIIVRDAEGEGGMALAGYAGSGQAVTWDVLTDVMSEVMILFGAAGIPLTLTGQDEQGQPCDIPEKIAAAELAMDQDAAVSHPMQRTLDLVRHILKQDESLAGAGTIVIMREARTEPLGEDGSEQGAETPAAELERVHVMHHGFGDSGDAAMTMIKAMGRIMGADARVFMVAR